VSRRRVDGPGLVRAPSFEARKSPVSLYWWPFEKSLIVSLYGAAGFYLESTVYATVCEIATVLDLLALYIY
jgi:hypothetical protein